MHDSFDRIRTRALETPAALALVAPGCEPLDYLGLVQEIAAGVQQLAAFGVRPDEVVAVAVPAGPEATVAMFCLLSAAVCAPINPGGHHHEIGRSLVQMRATTMVLGRGQESAARAAAGELGLRLIEVEARHGGRAGQLTWHNRSAAARVRQSLMGAADTVLLLQTSGTTAQPKVVPLTQANLLAAVQNMICSLELQSSDSTLNVMPLFHMHGLTTALATLLTGGRLVCVPGFVGDNFFRWLKEFSPTWITAAPAIHRAVLGHARAEGIPDGFHRLRVLRTGSAPLSLAEIRSLEALFATVVIEVWGMTEASCSTTNRLHWRKPGSVGQPIGAEVTVLDTHGQPLPAGQRGEVWVRGANVMQRYHSPPEANDDAFRDDWLRSGDEGYLDEDGFLFIVGRFKEQINRGGEKIAPAEIDDVVLRHPAVAEAAAFGLPHPRLGETVAVAVVLKPDGDVSVQDIQEHVGREAAQFKVPHHVFFTAALPKTATGKPQRLLLAQRFAPAAAPGGPAPPSDLAHATPLQQELHAIWAEVLGFVGFSVQDNFFYLGGDSLGAYSVLAEIRRRLGRELSLAALFHAPTVKQLAELLTTVAEAAAVGPKVLVVQDAGFRPPFYMLGGSFAFLEFASLFQPLREQPLFLIPPAALDTLPHRPSVAGLARAYLKTLRALQPQGPYYLGGYCFHGLVLQELACELTAQGEAVPWLALVDATPSQSDLRHLIIHGANLGRAFLRRRDSCRDELLWPWLNRADRLQRWWVAGNEERRRATLALVHRRLGRGRHVVHSAPPPPSANQAPDENLDYGTQLLRYYTLAMASHKMRRFSGRIELFLSEEYRAQTRRKPDRDWRRWALEVNLHPLRGDHERCLLVDHENFGQQLEALLPADAATSGF